MIEVKPCPFCNSAAHVYIDDYEGEVTIGCMDCGIHAHAFENQISAIQMWNIRK